MVWYNGVVLSFDWLLIDYCRSNDLEPAINVPPSCLECVAQLALINKPLLFDISHQREHRCWKWCLWCDRSSSCHVCVHEAIRGRWRPMIGPFEVIAATGLDQWVTCLLHLQTVYSCCWDHSICYFRLWTMVWTSYPQYALHTRAIHTRNT